MKKLLCALLAGTLMLSLVACGGGNGTETPNAGNNPSSDVVTPVDNGEPVYGGSATLYYSNFNQVFDPAMGEEYTYSLWLEYLWAPSWTLNDPDTYNFDLDTFTVATADGQIAKEWNWVRNGDGTSDLYVTIRDDIHFQDKSAVGMGDYDVFGGRNLTAADVVWTYSRLWGKGEFLGQEPFMIDGDWFNRFRGIVNYELDAPVEALGEYELVFHLATESESRLSEFMIAQVNITGHEWGELTADQQKDWHYACGTGPYILTDYVAGSHYKFTKNANYYDYDERYPENKLPYLDTITLTSVTDTAAAMASFIAGNLDFISRYANLSDDQAEQLIKGCNGNIQVASYAFGANSIHLKVNQAPFNDIRVRIAMQKAINLEEVNAAYYGYETELHMPTLWHPSLNGWSSLADWSDELKAEYTYDPDGAKALLAEAGYPDGFSFTVAIDGEADPDLFQLAKSYLSAVGIEMEITVLADMMEGRQVQGNRDDPRQFNMNIGFATDAGFAYQTYSTDGFAYCNYHEDSHMNELMAGARDAQSLVEQAANAKAADLYFAQNHWAIALSGETVFNEYLSSRIGGLENGELLSGQHFFKNFTARMWAKDGQ